MFGFKRKEEEQANLALIPQKENNIFTKLLARLFKKNKDEEESLDVNYSQTGSTKYSDIRQGEDNKTGKEVFSVDVSTNGMDTFVFTNLREDKILREPNQNRMTKLIRADLSQEVDSEEGETYKICFEIPLNVTLEEFLYADGLYTIIKSGNVDLDQLEYDVVNVVGNLNMSINPEMKMVFTVNEATENAKNIAREKYTPAWQRTLQMSGQPQKSQNQTALNRKDKIEENLYENRIRRIEDNRVVTKGNAMYITDPENGNIIKLEEVEPRQEVKHNVDHTTSVIYTAVYTSKTKIGEVEQLDYKRNIAFEISSEDMNALRNNENEGLTMQFRRMMSSANLSRYTLNAGLANNHIGYLRKGKEKYEILLASETSKRFLNELEKEIELPKGTRPESDDDQVSLS